MAAKQGLSAQISQASEDAKRAVLQRTALSPWFSNLNTTCTIKSAPPRTPEVLNLLSSKSGWLFKRNEQHVWQARWCCVVPHTFLYYFDASATKVENGNGNGGSGHPTGAVLPPPTSQQQENWNRAVRDGYGKRGRQHAPRSSLYHHVFPTTSANTSNTNGGDSDPQSHFNNNIGGMDDSQQWMEEDAMAAAAAAGGGPGGFSVSQPAGIIDLECYSAVNRSSKNSFVMELSGDETVNPDLRSFYFCALNDEDSHDWTQAFLGQRHSALLDERDAYRQVCDGFAQQLQVLHSQLEDAERVNNDQQEELYRVRSQTEELRRSCWRICEETLERSTATPTANTVNNETASSARRAYRADLETVRSQDMGLLAAVQLLSDYTRVLEETCSDLTRENRRLQSDLTQTSNSDQQRVEELEVSLKKAQTSLDQERVQWQQQMDTLQQKYQQSCKECEDLQNQVQSQRMEMTMHQSSTRTKVQELQTHKKILKKEVLDLRSQVTNLTQELHMSQHREKASKLESEQERKKANLLERYVEKMESQVKVQQNMMEMMSNASCVASVHGNSSLYNNTNEHSNNNSSNGATLPFLRSRDVVVVNTPSSVQADDDEVDDEVDDEAVDDDVYDHDQEDIEEREGQRRQGQRAGRHHLDSPVVTTVAKTMPMTSSRRSNSNVEDDNKSHLSELTEDRTQKQFFDAAYRDFHRPQMPSPRGTNSSMASGFGGGPPSYIMSVDRHHLNDQAEASASRLDTIMSTATRRSVPRNAGDAHSVSSTSGYHPSGSLSQPQRLSVAQRARLEADRQSTPVRVRKGSAAQALNRSATATATAATISRLNGAQLNAQNNVSSGASVISHRSGASQPSSSASFFSSWGKRLEDALDQSVLGVSTDMAPHHRNILDCSDDDESSQDDGEEKKASGERHPALCPNPSADNTASSAMSLQERQQLQRAKQLQFLKNQGIIKHDNEVRGGAGAASPAASNQDSVSVTSTSISYPLSSISYPGTKSSPNK